MKAPDKIYVPVIKPIFSKEQELYNEWKHQPLSLTIVNDNIEYVRKDALLEWAKEQAAIAEKLNGRGAMLKAWDSLIDKIESL